MLFENYYFEAIDDSVYYVAMTPMSEYEHRYIAISKISMSDAMSLIAKNTPMLVQMTDAGVMNRKEIETFLDKIASIESQKHIQFKILHGDNVDKKLNTL